VLVHGELWRAVSDTPLAVGSRVQVMSVYGLEVEVMGVEDFGITPPSPGAA
jgi:membrane protein implicated in regulation of membrane protease activity